MNQYSNMSKGKLTTKIDIQCECSITDWQHHFARDNFIEKIKNIVKKYFYANCSRNNKQRTIFVNSFFVTQCVTIPGQGFRLGQFCCRCKEGYYNPEIKAPDSSKSITSAHSCFNHRFMCWFLLVWFRPHNIPEWSDSFICYWSALLASSVTLWKYFEAKLTPVSTFYI